MAAQVISLGVSWFRRIVLAYTDKYGNLVLEIEGLPEGRPNVSLRSIFPSHVIWEMLNGGICYSNADDTRRRACAFKEWFRPSGNPRCEPCLNVKLARDGDAIILYRNERARVPEWCEHIRLLRADSLDLLSLPLIRDVNMVSNR